MTFVLSVLNVLKIKKSTLRSSLMLITCLTVALPIGVKAVEPPTDHPEVEVRLVTPDERAFFDAYKDSWRGRRFNAYAKRHPDRISVGRVSREQINFRVQYEKQVVDKIGLADVSVKTGGTEIQQGWNSLPYLLRNGGVVEFSNGARYQIISVLGNVPGMSESRTAYLFSAFRIDAGAPEGMRERKVALRIEKNKFRFVFEYTKFTREGAGPLEKAHVPHTRILDSVDHEYVAVELLEPWQIPVIDLLINHFRHEENPGAYDDDQFVEEQLREAEVRFRQKPSTRPELSRQSDEARRDALTEEQEIDQDLSSYRDIFPESTEAEINEKRIAIGAQVRENRVQRQMERENPEFFIQQRLRKREEELKNPIARQGRLALMGKLYDPLTQEDFQDLRNALLDFARKAAYFSKISDFYLFQFAYDRKTKQVILFDWGSETQFLKEKYLKYDAQKVMETGKDFRNPFSYSYQPIDEKVGYGFPYYRTVLMNREVSAAHVKAVLGNEMTVAFSQSQEGYVTEMRVLSMGVPSFFQHLYEVTPKYDLDQIRRTPGYGSNSAFIFQIGSVRHFITSSALLRKRYAFLEGLEDEIARVVAEERAKPDFVQRLRALQGKVAPSPVTPCQELLQTQ